MCGNREQLACEEQHSTDCQRDQQISFHDFSFATLAKGIIP